MIKMYQIYFMAILVRVMKIHIGNVINQRAVTAKHPHVQSANKLHFKGN